MPTNTSDDSLDETVEGSAAGRDKLIAERTRSETWKKPPRRIERAECITCDTCLRACPPEFNAIFDNGLDVVIIPELCSGCPKCVLECPVDCIYVDEDWTPTTDEMWKHIGLTAEGVS
ncbi:4Fe-4S dicluster-binding protein [Streptomyces sp. CBMA152]|uniref:4Fe-4S dicluster-binding protein n=1 Tax=unclassified Streptomyces TaxID=2593676 RepID=UPI001CB6F9D6|nr:4Fe-4S dicluster-binding protein [Streptomyces sp. CBMA152]MBD0744635.1 4Fe-4S ferredoxin [Streptomyces sp. CBMA152]